MGDLPDWNPSAIRYGAFKGTGRLRELAPSSITPNEECSDTETDHLGFV